MIIRGFGQWEAGEEREVTEAEAARLNKITGFGPIDVPVEQDEPQTKKAKAKKAKKTKGKEVA